MRNVVWVVALALVPLSGCIEGSEAADLKAVFGEKLVPLESEGGLVLAGVKIDVPKGTPLVEQGLVEGRVGGDASKWSGMIEQLVVAPKFAPPKSDPGPMGGGGGTYDLQAPAVNMTLEARLMDSDRLSGFEVRWLVIRGTNGSLERSEARPAKEGFSVAVGAPGATFVLAELVDGGVVKAVGTVPLVLSVNVQWTVDSMVRPFRPGGAIPSVPRPANYEQMADKFKFPVAGDNAALLAETKYRGTYSPTSGTDVDLQIDRPQGQCVKTSGSGGAGGAVPSPVESTEKIELRGLGQGVWTARVGTMTEGGMCAAGTYYNNVGPVPYTLTLTLTYPL